MARYVLRRLFYSIFVLAGLTVAVFFITRLIGDPARLMLPLEATEEEYLALRHAMGLDRPLLVQFADFASDVMRGDFGVSLWQGVPALSLVLSCFPATAYLALVTIVFTMLVALLLGIVSALKPGSIIDRVVTVYCFAGISIPTFWLALMLILFFAVTLGWFKTSGYGGPQYLILPVLSLSWYISGRMAQMVRSCMIDEMCKPHITIARAKGLSERAVIFRHALRNALIPILTMAGDQLAHLLSGAVIIEVIFGWPGVGQLAIAAIERRDFPVIQADVLVVAAIVIILNLAVDILYGWMDPRIRYS